VVVSRKVSVTSDDAGSHGHYVAVAGDRAEIERSVAELSEYEALLRERTAEVEARERAAAEESGNLEEGLAEVQRGLSRLQVLDERQAQVRADHFREIMTPVFLLPICDCSWSVLLEPPSIVYHPLWMIFSVLTQKQR
jgi:hypothetical protein